VKIQRRAVADAYDLLYEQLPIIRMSLDTPIQMESADGAAHWSDMLVSDEPTPEEHLLAAEKSVVDKQRCVAALARLKPAERATIIFQSEGHDNVTIAKVLGVSRERVRQLSSNARRVARGYPRQNKREGRGCACCGVSLQNRRDGSIFCSEKCETARWTKRGR